MVDPVAHFSPAPGLTIDRIDNTVVIAGNMELFGEAASNERAISIQQTINTYWTVQFPGGYQIKCNVLVRYRGPGTKAGRATQIEAKHMTGPSCTSRGDDRNMTLNANEQQAFTWTPAHEFGHVLGLRDRYDEGTVSYWKGQFGWQRNATLEKGYENNIMAKTLGVMERQNVQDLETETQAGSYGFFGDAQVLEWVNCHGVNEIRALSPPDKVNAIKCLMRGIISDGDVAAMGKICSSVTNPLESRMIRQSIDLNDFMSLAQRAQMRIFFARMP